MFDDYKHKIKSLEDLRGVIGPRPRNQRVVMCHGMFDIVHPGHIRHLLYAKAQGDILIASVTCDEHASKGEGRPYVPQELRAANLAALEAVDYVLIDDQPEPLANISVLQPDYFVKGFEYSADGFPPKTQEEIDLVSSYGGEFLFSPGDVVYSSTQLLDHHKPNITSEKTVALMDAEGVTVDQLKSTLKGMEGVRVHVIGDTIVDKYSNCTILGQSTKTPTFSVKLNDAELFVGGAGVVAKHLRSLGAEVTLTTVLGDDDLAKFVEEDLSSWGIRLNSIHEAKRPTTLKERFWADNYKLLQVDTVDNSPLARRQVGQIKDLVHDLSCDLVIFSDFRHGLFHSGSIDALTSAIPSGSMKAADSQVSSRWGNILDFQGFDLITPNEHEARFALGDQDSGVRHLAERLLREAGAKFLILKLGERGVLTYRRPTPGPRSFFFLDSWVDGLVDAVGAGDAMLAGSTLAMVVSQDIVQGAIIGNLAAALACETLGNVPILRNDLIERADGLKEGAQEMAR